MPKQATPPTTTSTIPPAPPKSKPTPPIPPSLYHTTLTSITSNPSTHGTTLTAYVLGTHTTLAAAHPFSLSALPRLGYAASDFSAYHTQPSTVPSPSWKYGPSVTVYTAPLPRGPESSKNPSDGGAAPPHFIISIATTPNTSSLLENTADQTVLLPSGSSPGPDELHYVLQTKTDYSRNRTPPPAPAGQDGFQTVDVEGCYLTREDAVEAAKGVLARMEMDGGTTQWDVKGDGEGYWPFGEDTVVHAVGDMGETYAVEVRTARGGVERFAKPMVEVQ
ncbi:hypothetical protein QBC39DRAFT_253516 [Podospora conica]|nr:hypothetical protein QBC39DRAFT_253516 [Schizothecium conicum]